MQNNTKKSPFGLLRKRKALFQIVYHSEQRFCIIYLSIAIILTSLLSFVNNFHSKTYVFLTNFPSALCLSGGIRKKWSPVLRSPPQFFPLALDEAICKGEKARPVAPASRARISPSTYLKYSRTSSRSRSVSLG